MMHCFDTLEFYFLFCIVVLVGALLLVYEKLGATQVHWTCQDITSLLSQKFIQRNSFVRANLIAAYGCISFPRGVSAAFTSLANTWSRATDVQYGITLIQLVVNPNFRANLRKSHRSVDLMIVIWITVLIKELLAMSLHSARDNCCSITTLSLRILPIVLWLVNSKLCSEFVILRASQILIRLVSLRLIVVSEPVGPSPAHTLWPVLRYLIWPVRANPRILRM